MNNLMIRVSHKDSEIVYEQSVSEALSFSASCKDGYSKGHHQETLIMTIKAMCEEVKNLSIKP